MELAIVIGVGAFIVLGIMFALLGASTKREEREDVVTRDIVIKANTGTVPTQEDRH